MKTDKLMWLICDHKQILSFKFHIFKKSIYSVAYVILNSSKYFWMRFSVDDNKVDRSIYIKFDHKISLFCPMRPI